MGAPSPAPGAGALVDGIDPAGNLVVSGTDAIGPLADVAQGAAVPVGIPVGIVVAGPGVVLDS